MIFKNKKLFSKFDLDSKSIDGNLDEVANEIIELTNTLFECRQNFMVTELYHKNQNNKSLYIDYSRIKDYVWSRDKNEIKQILYRDIQSKQFSIHKALSQINIIGDKNNCEYLKLLYFFYVTNYFVFPDVNIFKIITKMDYNNAFDEGTQNGECLHFILSNILDHSVALNHFLYVNDALNQYMNELSYSILDKNIQYEGNPSLYYVLENRTVFDSVWEFCLRQNYLVYCHDLLQILNTKECFSFEKIKIYPPIKWSLLDIPLEQLDDFIWSDALYCICKQKEKAEYREKRKFFESSAVSFLKQLILYDEEWNSLYNDNIIIEGDCIKALRVVAVIMSYNELVNHKKFKINAYNFRHSLQSNTTLPMRYFLLFCHGMYLLLVQHFNDFDRLFIQKEIKFLTVMLKAYSFQTCDEWCSYMCDFLEQA